MKRTIHISLAILMLLSVTEISKVMMLGYVLVTDFQKASHFCTCIDCCSSTPQNVEANMCVIDFGDHSQQQSDQKESHKEKPAVCSCSADTASQSPIAMINTLDKDAMLNPSDNLLPNQKSKPLFLNLEQVQEPDLDDIFHPPKA